MSTVKTKEPIIGIIGMGYAGLPVACLFAKRYRVIGYDMNRQRIAQLKEGVDRGMDFSKETLLGLQRENLHVTDVMDDLLPCNFYVVVVPTPVDTNNKPDLSFVVSASQVVGKVIGKGDVAVYESTVYPGVTEEVCVPEIERISGLKYNQDFFAGFSPERIDPSNKEHTIYNTVKITSGSNPDIAEYVDSVYGSVLEAGTCRAASIKVAEAAKILENTQRDVNIALMNEVSKIFSAMDIDTNKVIDAAATKWNFHSYRPGLVGGHCIGVDPYYLITKAETIGVEPELIRAARRVNDTVPDYIATRLVNAMAAKGISVKDSSILILGFTFKENCPDVRNTRVYDIYNRLKQFTDHIIITDPLADPTLTQKEYGLELFPMEAIAGQKYDAVLLCVRHSLFRGINIKSLLKEPSVVYDVKSFLDDSIVDLKM